MESILSIKEHLLMFKFIVLTCLITVTFAASSFAAEVKTYGKGINLDTTTKVSEILENPDNFIGKSVKIEGMVIEVCSKRGCWINVAGDHPKEQIQIKVTDGEIVFPMSATGKDGVFEGIVDEVKMSKDGLIAYKKHLAEEKGQPFDPSSVTEGTRYIRIIGLGASINQ